MHTPAHTQRTHIHAYIYNKNILIDVFIRIVICMFVYTHVYKYIFIHTHCDEYKKNVSGHLPNSKLRVKLRSFNEWKLYVH